MIIIDIQQIKKLDFPALHKALKMKINHFDQLFSFLDHYALFNLLSISNALLE